MADALVSFMLQKLDKVYLDYIHQEVSLVVGVEEDVKKLTTTFKLIQALLNDAELRQIKDKAVKLWLEEFKDIAYDMDDVLDDWSYEMHKSQSDTGKGNNKKKKKKKKVTSSYLLCSLCSCFSNVALRHNIGTRIKDIKERLDGVERDQKLKYGFVELKSDEKPIMRHKSSSFTDVSRIVGRAKDTETIMNKLKFLGESSTSTSTNQPESTSTQAPNIISIVGMGGLGKTTLAQRVFNEVKTHFEKTMWVCVSDPFDLVTVTKDIIREAKCEVPDSSEWNDTLHCSLIESLKGKRFLLVLDDVWTVDQSTWDNLEFSFRSGATGSRILVTTRIEKVALMMNATYTHTLGVLSDNDCSLLLCRIALAGRNEKNHKELKKIGEEISKKCKGLPLAAKTLGGLLLFKKSKKEWLHVLESEIWEIEDVENDYLMPSLLCSYYDLPIPLKSCFLYCSIFPKDHKIEKDILVKLWMAQGFLIPRSTNEELEMIGEDYFNNLVMRSFFQDFNKDDNGDIISCKMHDLVHDFAQFLTKNECSFTQINDTHFLNSSSKVRHLTLVCENEVGNPTESFDHFTSSVCNAKKLRTLQILNVGKLTIKEAPADLFHRFRCLKVLCLNRIGLENLSRKIENMVHLRYLDLSYNSNLEILPDRITNLYNLQTLKLRGCSSLCELPREMWRMINLRHLDISGTDELSHIPQGIGGLTSLRTLSDFIVGGASEGCKISELKNLNLLQGDLNIRGLGRVETVNEALEMVLKQKQLHSLTLCFKPNKEGGNGLLLERMEDVLDVLEPHPDVMRLKLTDYLGCKLSRWMESTSILSHVKTLELYGCDNLTKFPAFGQLPSLEVLDIRYAKKVKHIGLEFYSSSNNSTVEHVNCRLVPFPKLKELRMFYMDNLEVWELQHGVVMPCLRLIEVHDCRKLKALPAALGKLPSLEELTVRGPKEFLYEVDDEGETILFPNLKKLWLHGMMPMLDKLTMGSSKELEWEFGGGKEIIIMPCLRELRLQGLKNLKPFLEVVSLQLLKIRGEATEFIKYIRHDEIILFPNLKEFVLSYVSDMEELKIGFQVMPLLKCLRIDNCYKLKTIQGRSLSLELQTCPSLCELGIPNLKSLHIISGALIHPSLLEAAFATTTLQATLEELTIDCRGIFWTCIPEQVQQLTSLKRLELYNCGSNELKQRCRKDQGEDWRIISHIPNIVIRSH